MAGGQEEGSTLSGGPGRGAAATASRRRESPQPETSREYTLGRQPGTTSRARSSGTTFPAARTARRASRSIGTRLQSLLWALGYGRASGGGPRGRGRGWRPADPVSTASRVCSHKPFCRRAGHLLDGAPLARRGGGAPLRATSRRRCSKRTTRRARREGTAQVRLQPLRRVFLRRRRSWSTLDTTDCPESTAFVVDPVVFRTGRPLRAASQGLRRACFAIHSHISLSSAIWASDGDDATGRRTGRVAGRVRRNRRRGTGPGRGGKAGGWCNEKRAAKPWRMTTTPAMGTGRSGIVTAWKKYGLVHLFTIR